MNKTKQKFGKVFAIYNRKIQYQWNLSFGIVAMVKHFQHFCIIKIFHRQKRAKWKPLNLKCCSKKYLFHFKNATTLTIIRFYYSIKLIQSCTGVPVSFCIFILVAFNCQHNKFYVWFLIFTWNLFFFFVLFSFFESLAMLILPIGRFLYTNAHCKHTFKFIEMYSSYLQSITTVNIQLHQNHRINIHREHTAMLCR